MSLKTLDRDWKLVQFVVGTSVVPSPYTATQQYMLCKHSVMSRPKTIYLCTVLFYNAGCTVTSGETISRLG